MYIPRFVLSIHPFNIGVSTIWLLWIMAAMNIGLQVSVWVLGFNSFGYILTSEIAGLYGNSFLNFGEATKLFSTAAVPFLYSHQQYLRFFLSSVCHMPSSVSFVLRDKEKFLKTNSNFVMNFCYSVGIWSCHPVLWTLFSGTSDRETAYATGPVDPCGEKSSLQIHQFKQMHLFTLTLAFFRSFQKISHVYLQTFCVWTTSSSHWKVCTMIREMSGGKTGCLCVHFVIYLT